MKTTLRLSKIQTLITDYGFDDAQDCAEAYICDSICPAICLNPDCDYTTDMEPDQDRGWCEECNTNTVSSLFILMNIL